MARIASRSRCSLGAGLIVFALAGTTAAQNPKRFLVGPAYGPQTKQYVKLFEPGSPWRWVQSQADFFEFHVHSWWPTTAQPGHLSDLELEQAATMLQQTGMKVAVEAGGLRQYPGHAPSNWHIAGEHRAGIELAAYERWLRNGGELDLILLDGPIGKATRDLGMPWDVAAHELSDYLDIVKTRFPRVEVSLIEAVPHYRVGQYPTWGATNYGDLELMLDVVLPILEARGHPIASFTADSPYNYNVETKQGWEKLLAVQKLVQDEHGIRFGWFVNDEEGGTHSEELYAENTRKALETFLAIGGDVDDFNLRGWYDHPRKLVPEQNAFTFMGITRTLMRYVYGNYEAPNQHSVTVTFEDGGFGPLTARRGKVLVKGAAAEFQESDELGLRGLRYDAPTVLVSGEMIGVPPGSSTNVVLRPDKTAFGYRVALVTNGDGTSQVQVEAFDQQSGLTHILDRGPLLGTDPQTSRFHFAVRENGGFLTAEVDDVPAISVAVPPLESLALSVGVRFAGADVGRTRLNTIDFRESLGVTNVEFDDQRHVILSLYSEDLLKSFVFDSFLNSFEGDLVDYAEFEVSIFPYMEVLTLANDHAILRSTIPVQPSTLFGIVYGGDFEVVRAK